MDIDKQKQTINSLYICLIFGTILGFVPHVAPQLFALVLFISVLLSAYWYQFRDNEDGLLYNHMTYLIGTIWIGSTLLVLGILALIGWVYLKGDHSLVYQFVESIRSGTIPTEESMMAMIMGYMNANRMVLIQSSLCTIGPAILYLVYRIANGFSRGAKGYRIANPHSWF